MNKRGFEFRSFQSQPSAGGRISSLALRTRTCFRKNCEIDTNLLFPAPLSLSHTLLYFRGCLVNSVGSSQSPPVPHLSFLPAALRKDLRNAIIPKHSLIVTPFGRFCF